MTRLIPIGSPAAALVDLVQYLGACLTLALVVALLVPFLRRAGRRLGGLPRTALHLLLALTLLAASLRVAVPYPHIETFEVEMLFEELGRSMLLDRAEGYCVDGRLGGSCRARDYYYPAGHPLLVAVSYSLLGVGAGAARAVSLVLGTLSVPLAFLAALLLTRRVDAALLAAALLAVHPLHVRYSAVCQTEVPSMFAELLVLAAFLEDRRAPSASGRALLAASLALAVQMRLESPILLALFGAWRFLETGRLGPAARMLVPCLVLLAPHWLAYPKYFDPAYVFGESTQIQVTPELISNRLLFASGWLANVCVPVALVALALLGLSRPPVGGLDRAVLVVWWAVRIAIHMLHPTVFIREGSVLNASLPVVALAAAGGSWLGRRLGGPSPVLLLVLATGALHMHYAYRPLDPLPPLGTWRALLPLAALPLALWRARAARAPGALAAALAVAASVVALSPYGESRLMPILPERRLFELSSFAALGAFAGEDCYIASEQPFMADPLAGRRVLFAKGYARMDELVASGSCVIYHEDARYPYPELGRRYALREVLRSELPPSPGYPRGYALAVHELSRRGGATLSG